MTLRKEATGLIVRDFHKIKKFIETDLRNAIEAAKYNNFEFAIVKKLHPILKKLTGYFPSANESLLALV